MGSGADVYTFLGPGSKVTNSDSFTNFSAADLALAGITASDYGIYVFSLTGGSLVGNGFVNVTFANGVPLGLFVVAYRTNAKGNAVATPVTEAGTLALFGTGIIALARSNASSVYEVVILAIRVSV